MTDDLSRVLREAQEAAAGTASNIVEMLAEKVGLQAGAHAIFGDPVEHDGVTVIPVGKVRWGFGGGSGRDAVEDGVDGTVDEGAGGGGGAMASPLGFIEIRDGRAEFRKVSDPVSAVPVILASAVAAWVVLRGVRKLVRG
jgi:uncharacterized spore protein YtfJ